MQNIRRARQLMILFHHSPSHPPLLPQTASFPSSRAPKHLHTSSTTSPAQHVAPTIRSNCQPNAAIRRCETHDYCRYLFSVLDSPHIIEHLTQLRFRKLLRSTESSEHVGFILTEQGRFFWLRPPSAGHQESAEAMYGVILCFKSARCIELEQMKRQTDRRFPTP